MLDYLPNVGLSLIPYLIVAIVVGMAAPPLLRILAEYTVRNVAPEGYEEEKPTISRWTRIATVILRVIGLVILLIGLVMAFTNPSNTPKNETHDREAFAKKYRDLPAFQEKKGIITDRTRPNDMTKDQRQGMFDDMVDWRDSNDRKVDR